MLIKRGSLNGCGRRGEPMTLHRAEGVAVTLLDVEEGGGGA